MRIKSKRAQGKNPSLFTSKAQQSKERRGCNNRSKDFLKTQAMIRKWGTLTCDFGYLRNTRERRREK